MGRRNEQARALFSRAGGASTVAIAVNTVPKTIKPKKGKGAYVRRAKHVEKDASPASPASAPAPNEEEVGR